MDGGWSQPFDKKAPKCTDCGKVVSEKETLNNVELGEKQNEYNAIVARIRAVRDAALATVQSQLDEHAKKSTTLHSFWATVDSGNLSP